MRLGYPFGDLQPRSFVCLLSLAQNGLSDVQPPAGAAAPQIHCNALPEHQRRQCNEIHLVDAPVHHKIPHDTEEYNKVHKNKAEVVVEDKVEAVKRRVWRSEMETAHAIITAKLPKRTRDVLAMPPGERKRVIEERKAPLARRVPKKS
jgi:hypothetical protein